jgi:hypothetical protein
MYQVGFGALSPFEWLNPKTAHSLEIIDDLSANHSAVFQAWLFV